ncbi:hypothetical protein EIP91_000436 [Steccherinum ochraceum]|uniref:FAD/NAD(P)-binding domain-containing protein n=1 Tax=Steccherinum ochraceum TaxID=92696 RepID=A0A4R0RFZ4_9APHY|nr:hypothetical protein EIP91_000436 [Steccherinum ochraceum]
MEAQQESFTAKEVAAAWLADYAGAVTAGDVQAISNTILPDGWYRDVLTLTWDYRALEGKDKIVRFLSQLLKPGQIFDFALAEDPLYAPKHIPETGGVEAVFSYETAVVHGRGYARLVRGPSGVWKALSVCMMAMDLRGHEESGYELGIYGDHTLAWSDVSRGRKAAIEANPYVLIVGCGQTGLQIAARFKQMNIPSIVIEKNERVGDNWRKRYPTLTLHTIRNHHQMLYQPYPHNWPLFTPRDKVAEWLEAYAATQDLVIWTNSHIDGRPRYHDGRRKWEVNINRGGQRITIHPAHIVMATGTFGDPILPQLKDQQSFTGTTLHAAHYQGGALYAGKRVVVVGAGNSGIDICQDLCFHGAKSVAMIQRSSSCVVSGDKTAEALRRVWEDGLPVEVGDFKFGATSLGQLKKFMQTQTDVMWENEKELYAKLRKGGVALNMGPEGEGQLLLIWERGGGYWLDKGGADLIAAGHIRVKQGVQIFSFSKTGLVFEDGTHLEADAVIFATGFTNIRDCSRKIFGDEVIDRTGPVYGLDAEGELRGSYRPTGHPGLWFGTGDFYNSRFMSKQLAIQIKTIEIGLIHKSSSREAVPSDTKVQTIRAKL